MTSQAVRRRFPSSTSLVEVDGIHHLDAAQYWADMDRDNDFTLSGYRVLRFPAFAVRYNPGYIARKIREALEETRLPGEVSPPQ